MVNKISWPRGNFLFKKELLWVILWSKYSLMHPFYKSGFSNNILYIAESCIHGSLPISATESYSKFLLIEVVTDSLVESAMWVKCSIRGSREYLWQTLEQIHPLNLATAQLLSMFCSPRLLLLGLDHWPLVSKPAPCLGPLPLCLTLSHFPCLLTLCATCPIWAAYFAIDMAPWLYLCISLGLTLLKSYPQLCSSWSCYFHGPQLRSISDSQPLLYIRINWEALKNFPMLNILN